MLYLVKHLMIEIVSMARNLTANTNYTCCSFHMKIYGLSIVIRVVLLSLGCYIDTLQEPVKYTDIDYTVYTQAGIHLLHGKSPYEQETYRYSPILAIFMMPNSTIIWFGKLLFCIADVHVVQIFDELLQNVADGVLAKERSRAHKFRGYICFLWSVNPFSSNIASRGSSDSISNILLLWMIKMVCT